MLHCIRAHQYCPYTASGHALHYITLAAPPSSGLSSAADLRPSSIPFQASPFAQWPPARTGCAAAPLSLPAPRCYYCGQASYGWVVAGLHNDSSTKDPPGSLRCAPVSSSKRRYVNRVCFSEGSMLGVLENLVGICWHS